MAPKYVSLPADGCHYPPPHDLFMLRNPELSAPNEAQEALLFPVTGCAATAADYGIAGSVMTISAVPHQLGSVAGLGIAREARC